jgi:phosphoserine phosphatase
VDIHKKNGDRTLVITATNSFVTRPIAQAYGINELLATEPEMVKGKFNGKVSGIPCFQIGKVHGFKNLQIIMNYSYLPKAVNKQI